MNQLKRKNSSKIDLQIKLFALDLYNRGTRISLISKKIGYSEPTIKYWINHSESIRSQDKTELNSTSFKEFTESINCQPNEIYRNLFPRRLKESSGVSSEMVRYSGKRLCSNCNNMLSDIENNILYNSNSFESEENAHNEQVNSAASTKDTENMILNSPPKISDYYSYNGNLLNQTKTSNGIIRKTYTDLSDSNDYKKFKNDFTNCQEALEELMEYITAGKKLINKASNFLYQMQETMNDYEIIKKVKYECQ